jgi:hypothetical protein
MRYASSRQSSSRLGPSAAGGNDAPAPDRLPACEKNRRQLVELGPEGIFATCCRIKLQSNRGGNTELGRASVFRDVKVPRQRVANGWIVPHSQLGQVAHARAPVTPAYIPALELWIVLFGDKRVARSCPAMAISPLQA